MARTLIMPQYSLKESIRLLKRILAYFKEYKLRIFIAIIALSIASAVPPAIVYLLKETMNKVFAQKDLAALTVIPPCYVLLTVIKGTARYFQNYLLQYCALHVLEKLRDELYNKIIFLPLNFFESSQVGKLMSHIMNDVAAMRNSLSAILVTVRETMTAIGLIFMAFYLDSHLATIAVIGMPFCVFIFVYIGRKLRKLGRKSQNTLADISIFLHEIFSGIRIIKAFSTEQKETQRFAKENKRLVYLTLNQVKASELSSPVMEVIGAIAGAVVIYYGGSEVIAGHSDQGTFMAFLASIALLYEPIQKVSLANNDVQKALAGAERVFGLIDSPELQVERGGDTVFDESFKTLSFSGVTFAYNKESSPALKDVTFTINAGDKVAIVGPSGAGKTTFINLLPRFYEQQEGSILLNGRDIKEYTLGSLRKSISIVSQDTFLFDTNILENIAYGNEELNEEKAKEAARLAYANHFIEEMADGYGTHIGERGVKLSGGQKQRLTIARAIYKDSPLLILDEATSALDSESESIVQQALENLMENRTSIVIAHRLSTVLNATRILVMDAGRVIAEGTHKDLLTSCDLYRKLCELQFVPE